MQYTLQPSPEFLFPSSHSSVCVFKTPSPHIVPHTSGEVREPPVHDQPGSTIQLLEHPSPLIVFPSSQLVSVSTITIPSPQISPQMSFEVGDPPKHWRPDSTLHILEHPSLSLRFPSSHC